MGPAGEIAFVEPCLVEQASHRLDMHPIAAVRGASDRKLGIAKPKRIGGAALDEGQGLQRFHRGAWKDRALDIAKGKNEAAGSIGNRDGAGMAALDDRPPHHLDEHGI
jgi:hypothetical protein